jgi:parallel beta-helix repeat protein
MPSPGSRSRRRASCWAIERLETRALLATIIVTSAADTDAVGGGATLRAAIESVNAGANVGDILANGAYGTDDTIDFNIPGGFQTINVNSTGLPTVRRRVFIDGLSQPGSSPDAPMIQLDGNATSVGDSGLNFNGVVAGVIRGLDIVRFNASQNVAGIMIIGGSGNWVENNFIGINAAGTPGSPGQLRNRNGVAIQLSDGNFVYNNLISGNTEGAGVLIDGTSNNVLGNRIGTDRLGVQSAPNLDGVDINTGTGNAVQSNLISGNDDTGVLVVSADNLVTGNMIGTNTNGTRALANTHDGIDLIVTATGTLVESNVISGNGGHGIVIDGANNQIKGNKIGTDIAGLSAVPNLADGILLRIKAVNNLVSYNTIAFNGQIGVAVTGAGSVGNVITGNSMFANGALGIDLGADGVTPNQPNNPLNFPVLTQVEVGTELTLVGVSPVGATIELFIAAPDPSGFGQGKTLVTTVVEGSASDLDPSPGGFRFVVQPLLVPLPVEAIVTATSTTSAGTSEFSANATVTAAPVIPPVEPPPLVTVVALRRFGFHEQPTHIVLVFSSSLDAASAQELGHYKLTSTLGGSRRVMLHIKSATYDPASLTVTLKPKQLLPLKFRYNLKVSGVLDGLGRLVMPFEQTFGRSALAGPSRV